MEPEPVVARTVGPPPLTDPVTWWSFKLPCVTMGRPVWMPPEPDSALRVKWAPGLMRRWTLPEPVSARHSEVGLPWTSIEPEPEPAREFSIDAVDVDGAGAGLGLDVAGGGEGEFEVAGAGLEGGCAVDVGGADVARAGAEVSVAGDVVGVDGAGAGAGRDGALVDAADFDVARAGAGFEGCGARGGDVVVDGDVAEEVGVGVIAADGDGVAGLDDGRRGDDLLDAPVGIRTEPTRIGVDVADDVDPIVRAGIDVDVARAGGDGQCGCAGEVERLVEVAVGGKRGGGGDGEGEGEKDADVHEDSLARGTCAGERQGGPLAGALEVDLVKGTRGEAVRFQQKEGCCQDSNMMASRRNWGGV